MSREIKFRAWDDKSKKMWAPEVICFMKDGKAKAGLVMTPAQAKKGQHEGWFYDNPLMQYTGLHDKNSKEIYEGDILKYFNNRMEVVEYEGGGFSPFAIPGREIVKMPSEVEVIGNIYENPEIMEAKNV